MALALRRFSAALAITGPGAGAAFAALAAGSKAARLLRVEMSLKAATATNVGLIRAVTEGTATTTTAGQAHNPSDGASGASIASAWSAAPTIAGSPVYMRRVLLPATVGTQLVWTFDDVEMLVAPGTPLLLWNFGAGAASDVELGLTWNEP